MVVTKIEHAFRARENGGESVRSEEKPWQSTTPPAEAYKEGPSIVKYHLYSYYIASNIHVPSDVPTGRFGLMYVCAIPPTLTLDINSLVKL